MIFLVEEIEGRPKRGGLSTYGIWLEKQNLKKTICLIFPLFDRDAPLRCTDSTSCCKQNGWQMALISANVQSCHGNKKILDYEC